MANKDLVRVRLTSETLACDQLHVARMHAEEALGRPFDVRLDVSVLDPSAIDVDAMLGAEVTLVFEREGYEPRRVHGMIEAVTDLYFDHEVQTRYELRFVPRVRRLALAETQETFLGKTVPQIVEDRLARCGLRGEHDIAFQLTESYTARDLVVQYRETDLAFVSRLAENLGITMRFDHEGPRDRVVFSDSNAHFAPCTGGPLSVDRGLEGRHVLEVRRVRALAPVHFYTLDYNDQHPRLDLEAGHAPGGDSAGARTVVEYGSYHRTNEEGVALAKIRAEERAWQNGLFEGRSTAQDLEPGRTITIEGHARIPRTPMLVLEVVHDIEQAPAPSGSAAGGAEQRLYANRFVARPIEGTYRPPRRTPKPRIVGLVHAVVEGTRGGAIKHIADVDEQGRYSIRFYFDMSPEAGRIASSPRVRMLQPHAGPGYGMHFPLKPDVEVLVAFIDGDPDRPVIVGAVPNPLTASPVTSRNPQAHKLTTQSGLFLVMKDL
jgi:type VI secretion system secreted protein VgrG